MIAYCCTAAPDGAMECSTPKGRIRSRDHHPSPWADPTPWFPLGDLAALRGVGVDGWGRDRQVEGVARVAILHRWTLVSLFDRSGDRRHGSHASFCFDAEIAPRAAVTLARITFPSVLERIDAHLLALGLALDVQAVP